MAKLTILLALLAAALLFAAHASARRPSVSTSCERQLERVNLRPCEQHILQKIRRHDEEDQDEENVVLSMRGTGGNFFFPPSPSRDFKRSCCNQLSELEERNSRCICEALQQIMENQRYQLQGRKERERFERELRNLPDTCGIEQYDSRGCEF